MSGPLLIGAAEAAARLRVEPGDEDETLEAFSLAAQDYFERATGLVLTRRKLVTYAYEWPADGFALVSFPVHGARVFYIDADAVEQQVPDADIALTAGQGPQRLEAPDGWPDDRAPGSEIRIEVDCGFAEGGCPASARQGVLLLLGHFYRNREGVMTGPGVQEVPLGVRAMIDQWRQVWVA